MNYKCTPGDYLNLNISIHLSVTDFIEFTSAEIEKVITDYLNKKRKNYGKQK